MLKLPAHSPSRKAGGNVSDKSLACAVVDEKKSVESTSETSQSLLHTLNGEGFIGISHNEQILFSGEDTSQSVRASLCRLASLLIWK
jgi:hypothetical protein